MKKRLHANVAIVGTAMALCASVAHAAPPKDPPTKCAPDAVLVGSSCVDKYEASVWRIPSTNLAGKSNERLVKKVRKGKADVQDLLDGNATQLGTGGDDYAPCGDKGELCKFTIIAASLPGVTPSAYITWFQANIACVEAGKRLPSNKQWQMAVTGSPDPGGDNGTTDCNTASAFAAVATGSRSSCVSAFGAYDMVGNLDEWVADWVPLSTTCGSWSGSGDNQCLAGADTAGEPGALLRGSDFNSGAFAGPLAVLGLIEPSFSDDGMGFRCAR